MSSPIECSSVLAKLAEFATNDLSPEDHGQVSVHLAVCESCRHEFERQSQVVSAMRGYFQAFRPLRQRINLTDPSNEAAQFPFWLSFSRLGTYGWIGLGAAIILFGILFQSFQGSPLGRPDPSPSSTLGNLPRGITLSLGELELVGTSMKAHAGGLIPTGARCRALQDSTMEFRAGSSFFAQANAQFQIGPTEVILFTGAGRFAFRPGQGNFRVKTPCAILGIRGTRFGVVAVATGTVVDLTEGKLEVEASGNIMNLYAGELLVCCPGLPARKMHSPDGFWDRWIAARGDFQVFIKDFETLAGQVDDSGVIQPKPTKNPAPSHEPPPVLESPAPDPDGSHEGKPEDATATQPTQASPEVLPDGF